MTTQSGVPFPVLRSVVLDTTDARGLADFYRELLGYVYEPGDEPPPPGEEDEAAWIAIHHPSGSPRISLQKVEALARSSWPDGLIPQQLHIDLTVPTLEALETHHQRALALGATVLEDRSADEEEPLWVFADPAGHPFCIFVAAG